jgi:hypothetical protein
MEAKAKRMVIELDIDTGKVLKVTDGEKEIKPVSAEKATLNGKRITSIPDHTLIFTHSSPGCAWYFVGGKLYYICK